MPSRRHPSPHDHDHDPELTIVWAMLAGGAPLHAERLAARGGPAGVADPRCFYDISSYGVRGAPPASADSKEDDQ